MGFAALTVFVLLVWYFRHSFQVSEDKVRYKGVVCHGKKCWRSFL